MAVLAVSVGRKQADALADSDERVVRTVAELERNHGLEPKDWPAVGRAERGGDDR